jgi:hypothetical protein
MKSLDIAVRTLFAEFQEAAFARLALENGLYGQGTYVKKQVKGKIYWYMQRYVDGVATQKYFSPSSPKTDQQILNIRNEQTRQRRFLRKMNQDEGRKAAMLRRGGLPSLDSLSSSIISSCSEIGIIVGSHAFSAYSGMLGVLFESASLKTMDIDIACDKTIEATIAKPVDVLQLLKSCSEEFREIPQLLHRYPPHSFVGPDGIRVDIVTPLRGKPKGSIRIKNILNAAAEPLRFLDFLIYDPVRAVLIGPKGGIPVTVPDPSRFAIHKLIVSSRRSATETAKRAKDIFQARQLMEACLHECPVELSAAYEDAIGRGKNWKKAVDQGTESLPADLVSQLKKSL